SLYIETDCFYSNIKIGGELNYVKDVQMVKNKHLAKSIHEVGWNQLINFTTYKAENAGKEVKLVNPHNTSQECSSCGELVKKTLAEREHICSCGYIADRDINASINILNRGLSA